MGEIETIYSDETIEILKKVNKEILSNLGYKLASGLKGDDYKRTLRELKELKRNPFWKGRK